MADEEVVKVLKIRTQVEGDAVSKLQLIQQELGKLSTGQTRRSMQAATEQATEFQRAAARLSQSALGIGRTFKDLSVVLGPIPVAIGLIGYEIVRQINAMKEHARASTEMSHAARRAGLGAGEYALITDNLRKAGLNAQQATGTIQGFSRAIAELSIQGSERRQQIMRDAGPYYAELQTGLVKMQQAGTYYRQMQEAQRIANNVAANEFNQSHNARMAAFRREQILRDLGMEQLIDASKDLENIDESRKGHLDEIYEGQEKLNAALDDEQSTREQIYREAMGWAAGFNTALVNLTTEFEKGLLSDLERGSILKPPGEGVQPGLQPGVTKQDWSKKGGVIDPSWGWHNLFGRGGGAQHFGDADPADVLGLAPGSLGYGNIASGWRHSQNVEDHSDRVEDQTKAVDQNTDQLHGLNLRMKRWLDQDRGSVPIRAMDKGGVVHGPTRALVGEAGPEAIVSKRGTQVVTKPTHATLGTDGAEAVVPLGAEHLSQAFKGSGAGGAYTSADVRAAVGGHLDPNTPTDVLAQARHVALSGGPGAVDAFMKAQGYPKDPNWCGDFAASVVHSLGGTVPGGAQVASNWRNYGERVTGQPQPGDVAVAIRQRAALTGGKPIATGATGSHVTFVQDYDPKSDRITGFGGNQAAWATTAPAKGFEYFRPQVAMAGGGIVVPSMGAAPPGLGGPTTAEAGFSGDTVTAAGHAAYAAAASRVQNVASGLSSSLNVLKQTIFNHQPISTKPGLAEAFRPEIGIASGPVSAVSDLKSAGIHGVLDPMLTQAGMSSAGAGLTSDIAGIVGTKSIFDRLPGFLARGKQAVDVGKAGLEYEHETADRKTVDGAAGGGGTIEGTMTIEQRTENVAKPRREPLFRPTHIDRRAQMTPAQGGPGAQSAEASSISYGW